jgi:phosphoglycerate kinase
MFTKKTVKDVNLRHKVILMRTDYNVPIENGIIMSDFRIRSSLPTINYILENGASKLVLISHLGRPEGRDKSLSLKPVANHLAKLMPNKVVRFVADNCGPEVEDALRSLPTGGVLLLENLRFSSEEEADSEDFARDIVDSIDADIFVQDGFAVVHRAHASTDAITKIIPSVAGLLLEKEVSSLSSVRDNPKKPLLLIIGGAKVEDKQPLIDKFLQKADKIAVAGKISADGYASDDPKIYVAADFSDNTKFDISSADTERVVTMIKGTKTVIWNGLTGKAEDSQYANSSIEIAETLGNMPEAVTIICGGDTTGFVENLQSRNPNLNYTLISTGGGASLELLLGRPLPGLDALEDKTSID